MVSSLSEERNDHLDAILTKKGRGGVWPHLRRESQCLIKGCGGTKTSILLVEAILDRTKIRGREADEEEEEERTICLGIGNELKDAIDERERER